MGSLAPAPQVNEQKQNWLGQQDPAEPPPFRRRTARETFHFTTMAVFNLAAELSSIGGRPEVRIPQSEHVGNKVVYFGGIQLELHLTRIIVGVTKPE